MRILINRNDNLGDIVYTLQLATLLKQCYQNCHISFLIRDYAKDLFGFTTNIDSTLSFETLTKASSSEQKLMLADFDIFINAKADKLVAKLAKKAAIKMRIGTSHRLYHWFYCNKRVNIKRKNSSLHETQLNTLLLKPLIQHSQYSVEDLFKLIQLKRQPQPKLKQYLVPSKINIICHPASNGNGREWPIENYIRLIQLVDPKRFNIILTGSPKEKNVTAQIQQQCPSVLNLAGQLSLKEMISLLGMVDYVIASGTGPLHIAAALGTQVIGLFPPIHALDIQRWGPAFKNAHNLQLKQNCQNACSNKSCQCMYQLMPGNIASFLQQANIDQDK